MMESCILIRYGEVAVKSARKRPYFEKLFINAVRESLTKHSVHFDRIENLGKLYAIFTSDIAGACQALGTVAGIETYSIASRFFFDDYDSLLDTASGVACELVAGKTFRVTAKRSGKQSFSSMQLARDLGSRLEPYSNGVDLSDPEHTVYVEVRQSACYVFSDYTPGLGGLPPASTGRALMLFSGGLDSPVASFEMLKRGCALDYVFINMVGDTMLASVSKVYDYLISRYAFNHTPKFFHVDGRPLRSFLKSSVPERLRQIAFKMSMYMICDRLARDHELSAFVTGESLSQKSSQTLASLSLIDRSSSSLVLRPLIARDKTDIIDIARDIGTFAASESVKEQCNLSEGPVTAIPVDGDLDLIPDLSAVVEQCVSSVDVRTGILDLDTSVTVSLDDIDTSRAVVVDLRTPSVCQKHPLDSDITIPYPAVLDHLDRFKKGEVYLIVCSQGVLSYELAHILKGRRITAVPLSVKEYRKLFS